MTTITLAITNDEARRLARELQPGPHALTCPTLTDLGHRIAAQAAVQNTLNPQPDPPRVKLPAKQSPTKAWLEHYPRLAKRTRS